MGGASAGVCTFAPLSKQLSSLSFSLSEISDLSPKPKQKRNQTDKQTKRVRSSLPFLPIAPPPPPTPYSERPVSRLHFLLSRCPDLPHCVAFIFYFDIFLVCQCSPFNFVFLRTRRIQVPSSYSILLLLLRYLPFNRENTQMTDTIVK